MGGRPPERDEKKPERREERPKRGGLRRPLLSFLLSFMLLMAFMDNAYASAGLIDSIKEKVSSGVSWIEEHIDEGMAIVGGVAGGYIGGAILGAKIGAVAGSVVPGIGNVVGAILGFGVGLIAGKWLGDQIQERVLGIDDESKTTTYNPGKVPNKEELEGNDTKKLLMSRLRAQLDEEVYQDLQDLMNLLSATMIDYNREITGSIGYFDTVQIQGPSSIYGFSAFPVTLYVHAPDNPDLPNPVWITQVCIWVEDNQSNHYYDWCYNKPVKLEGSGVTFATIMKAPDPMDAKIRQILANGFATEEDIREIFSAVPPKFEIKGYIKGKAEIWTNENGNLKFVENKTIEVDFSSLSAYQHISSHPAVQLLPGEVGSLPLHFRDDQGWVPYATKAIGASSNLIFRGWAQPVHVMNSGALWRFYVIQNPEYPLNGVNITDEYRLEAYRITASGGLETAYKLTGSLGSMSKLWTQDAQIYYTATNDTVGFRVLYLVRGTVNRGDIQIPLWMLAEPQVAVLENAEVVANDQATQEVIRLTDDGELSKEDLKNLQALADTMIQGLQEKLQRTQEWLNKAEQLNKKEAVDYGKEAVKSYQKAIDYAEKLKGVQDPDNAKRYFKIIKDYEMRGDYYYNAMIQAYYGNLEQAQELADMGSKLDDEISEYTGGFVGAVADKLSGVPLIGDALSRAMSGDWVAIIGLLMLVLGIIGALREVLRKRRTNAQNVVIFLLLALLGVLILSGAIPFIS